MGRPDEIVHEPNSPTTMFKDWISGTDFSCLGGRAAVRREQLTCVELRTMSDMDSTRRLHGQLVEFVRARRPEETDFGSFAAIFEEPQRQSEEEFEKALWGQLEMLHDVDREKYEWARGVSSDPHSPRFAYSVAGHPFFVVGLHSQASRISRRFPYPVLVFNSHLQFDRLKQSGLYASLQTKIRARELRIQGSVNPNLSDFGQNPESVQYSGRANPERWRCPWSGGSVGIEEAGQ
ncbi:guanitoxin biosynthesis heme-dependent pre-guanitoxin N-hydroxylase GntA [Actinoplanes sp. NPDC049548]|uniref:guanitoxin biosynthesis heme-dependent pre-guanitoxin N-hydroxylase GntA n=1 Tax=Actinoplanes sp. NPDC049548 TaxID=3155152 RepID=UPI00342C1162